MPGCVLGYSQLSSLYPGYKTIAFSAAVIWIFFGLVLAYHAARPLRGYVRISACIALALVAIFALLEFSFSVLGSHFFIETISVQAGEIILDTVTTPISPVASGLAVPISIALVLMLYPAGQLRIQQIIRSIIGIIGSLVTLICFTYLLSILYGAPFLYGSQIMPIAFLSALAALLIGVGLICAAGPFAFPLVYFTGSSTQARLLRVFLPLTIIIIIVQNFIQVTFVTYYKLHDALVIALIIVIFSLITCYVVVRVSVGVGRFIDSTEKGRKDAEIRLQETNEYLRNLLDYANAPIIVWDPDFRITRFNHAFERLTGRTELEVVGQDLSILFPGDTRNASMDQIKKTVAGERWEVVEIPILNVSGETRIVLWNSANIARPDKTIISTIAQGQDITDRKRAEEALKENEYKFQVLADFTYDWAYWIDREFNVIYSSPSCERITGYSSEDFIRDRDLIYRITYPDDRELFKKHTNEVNVNPAEGRLEFRIIHRDGSVRWLGHVCRPITDSAGMFLGTRVSNRDISDRKRAEETLHETNEYLRNLLDYANAPIIVWDPEFPDHKVQPCL